MFSLSPSNFVYNNSSEATTILTEGEDTTTPQLECFGVFQTFNASDAEAKGVELELTWIPVENLTLSGFYSFLDSEFTDTNVPGSVFEGQTGNELIRAPRHKYNINAEYILPLQGKGELTASVSYRFTDDQRGELEPYAIQPSFDLFDARLAWNSPNNAMEIAVWGKNLFDEEHVTHLYTIAGEVISVFGDPQMYGVSLTYRYD